MRSVAARDIDGVVAAVTGHGHALGRTARHVRMIRRRYVRRKTMRPVPRHVLGIGVVDAVRRVRDSLAARPAIRTVAVVIIVTGPIDPAGEPAAMSGPTEAVT